MADPAATADATSAPDATSGADDKTQRADAPASSTQDAGLGEEGKRAIDALRKELREREARVKELEQAERERQDAERTEIEKATTRAESAEKRVAELEKEGLARTIAIDAGIPDAWERLRGSTREELEADAKAFVERYGTQQQQQQDDARPDLGSGARQTAPATGTAAFSERLRRQARGR